MRRWVKERTSLHICFQAARDESVDFLFLNDTPCLV